MNKFVLEIDPIKTASHFGFTSTNATRICSLRDNRTCGTGLGLACVYLQQGTNAMQCMWCSRRVAKPMGLPIAHVGKRIDVLQMSSHSGAEFVVKEEGPFVSVFDLHGSFCSLRCQLAWWNDYRHLSRYEMCGLYLQHVWDLEYGRQVPFVPAPDRHLLSIFGGSLSWDEFHA
jgi:hypothetical protein